MAALLALTAVALAVLASLWPLLGAEPVAARPDDIAELEAKREETMRSLREIEMDHEMGKITGDDRDRLRAELEGRAVRILAAIDRRSGQGTESGA